MQRARAVWFRDVCWALVVWFCAYSVHAVILAEEHLRSELQALGPAVAYAQPTADRTPLAPPLHAHSTARSIPTLANLPNSTFQANALRLNIENALRRLPLDGHASLPGLDVSALVEKTRATQVASATASAGLEAPLVAQVIPPPAAAPTTALRSTSPAVTAQAQAVSNDPDPLLASTPDANATDPFIVQKAAALGNNPAQIFAFVRAEIGYESYKGSLRGARGTLWSKAGNALDRASLMVALLRASGIRARYVSGVLSDTLARQLIASMFPSPLRIVGCLDANTQRADPVNDSTLLAETREHFWVEFDSGGSFQSADPSFAGAQIGQTFAAVQQMLDAVPDALRHKVTIRLKREMTIPQSLLGTPVQDVAPVLDVTADTVQVVGKPLSLGHFVNTSTLSSPIFVSVTNTYSPFLIVAGETLDSTNDGVIRGQDYQEVLTNFPFGSSLVTGVFLEIDVIAPNGTSRTYKRTLGDRIGLAVRRNGGSTSVTADPQGAPLISPLDMTTISILPGRYDRGALDAEGPQLDALAARLTDFSALAAGSASASDADRQALADQAVTLMRTTLVAAARARLAMFQAVSDQYADMFAGDMVVKAYFDSPRITLARTRVDVGSDNSLSMSFSLDLRKNDIRAIAFPEQNIAAAASFKFLRGLIDTSIETAAVGDSLQAPGLQFTTKVSAQSIFTAAQVQGIDVTILTPDRRADLDPLDIPADAKILIGDALAAGAFVTLPVRSVLIGGQPRLGWYESDPATGETIGVLDDGTHGVLEDVAGAVARWVPIGPLQYVMGLLTGLAFGSFNVLLVHFLAESVLEAAPIDERFKKPLIVAAVTAILGVELYFLKSVVLTGAFGLGVYTGWMITILRILHDPPLTNVLVSPPSPATFSNLQGTDVAVGVVTDPDFTLPFGDNPDFTLPFGRSQLPTAFRLGIQNRTSSSDTFQVTLTDIPASFTAQTSVTQITVPPGQTGEVGVCLRPTGTLGAPGTAASFSLNIASVHNPAIAMTTTDAFTLPTVHAVTLTSDPSAMSTTPGNPFTTRVVLQAAGNVPEDVTFSVAAPASVSASSLSPVSLHVGQSVTQMLTLTPQSGAPLDTPLTTVVTASFGAASGPQSVSTSIRLTLLTAQAQSAFAGAQSATALGRTDIGTTLSGLTHGITGLTADPSNPAAKAAVLAYLDNLILEMNAPFLADFIAQLQAIRNALAAVTTPTAVTDALNQLSTVLASLNTVLSSPVAFPFDLLLAPNSALALPGQQTTFKVLIVNKSTATNTYNLSRGPLPSGVTGGLNVTSVTLPPGGDTSAPSASDPVVTLTETGSSLVPAEFTATASIVGVNDSARSTKGTLTVQQEFLAVTSVQANPGIANPGNMVDVTAQLANVVNESKTVNVSLAVKNAAGTVVLTPPPQSVQLSIQSLTTMADFGQISTQGLANGSYTLAVTVTDPATGQPLPGGTGTGTLLVGLPVTATLTVSPQTLSPGNGQVTTTLTVDGPGNTVVGSPFALLGNVATPSAAESLAVNGTIAYACDDNEITAIDVTDPAHPVKLATAGADSLKNDGLVHCSIQQGKLVAFADANSSLVGNNPVFLYFDLTNPSQPTFVHSTSVQKKYFMEPVYIGNIAFVPTLVVFFFSGDGYADQRGDVVAVDISDLNNPHVLGTMDQGVANFDTTFGGHHPVYGGAVVDAHTLLAGTTSATGGGSIVNSGVGQLLVVDVSNPATMSIVKTVDVPGTVHLYKPIIQGNLAIAIGSSGGYQVPCCGPDIGNIVIATFDITDPHNPTLLQTVTTSLNPANGGGQQAIGNNLFLFAGIQDSSNHLLLMQVDTTDPMHPTIQTFQIPTQVNRMVAVDTVLYTVGPNGLTTYSIPGVSGTQYSATVLIDKNGTVTYDSASFSVAPTSITNGTGFDTVKWLNPGTSTITWHSTVTGIEPGQVVPVAEGGTVSFRTALGSGTIPLPPVSVTSDQILGLSPPAQTVQPGQLASYVVTVKNPTTAPLTYTLGVEGIAPTWVTLAEAVTVPVAGQMMVPLALRSELAAAAGSYAFVVTASAPGGVLGSVHGTLTLQGLANIGQPTSTTALGVSVTLVPTQGTAGQGTTATFGVQVTNAGNTTDTYTLSAGLPTGVSGVFDQTSLQVPPGLSNFRQVNLHLTPSPGTSPGSPTFTVTAVSTTKPTVQSLATGTLTIAGNGVRVALNPPSAGPGSTFQMTVRNTGQGQDTFDLSLGGPAAVVAALGTSAVTLAPGASQIVPISVGAITFAVAGSLNLTAVATSRGNPAVQNSATATVTIAATQGMTAHFDPASVTLPTPGSATFLLLVTNTGNTEDAYTATITGTTGPITARLTGLDGQPTQTIPTFRLPGLSSGALVFQATLTAAGQGRGTVRITSLTTAAITASATATVQTLGGGNQAPVANAGPDQTVPMGQTVLLDGSASDDPDHGPAPLSFQWGFTAKPPGSTLSNAQISGATTAHAAFTPDVLGDYTLRLTVSDGALSAADDVVIHVQNTPPVAVAGPDRYVQTGTRVTLDGSGSFDRNNNLITYDWTLVSQPAGSTLTSNSPTGRQTPNPAFTPDVSGPYVFQLVVNDGLVNSAPDTVAITASPSNVPPNADAGPDQSALVHTEVELDGSASYDPDQGPSPLTYQWSFTQVPAASALQNANILHATQPQARFVPDVAGVYGLNLRVSDGAASANAAVMITASAPNVPPNADAGVDQTVPFGADVVLEGSGSYDPDNGPAALSYAWHFVSLPSGSKLTNASIVHADMATARFTPDVVGSYVVRLEVFDGAASAFDNVLITATCLDHLTASPNVLWPPNHKMVPVTVALAASNRCQAPPSCQVSAVSSNEPINGLGDGDTAPDWQITGPLKVNLRAERAGQGQGRVYTITVSCTEAAGLNSMQTTTVTVPHDQPQTK